ncbi:hypothetical protein J6590_004376 [Homalodisca vitripennis]|nr:hypothetical protein J6590_004376 [Homalodisca vitripennis]
MLAGHPTSGTARFVQRDNFSQYLQVGSRLLNGHLAHSSRPGLACSTVACQRGWSPCFLPVRRAHVLSRAFPHFLRFIHHRSVITSARGHINSWTCAAFGQLTQIWSSLPRQLLELHLDGRPPVCPCTQNVQDDGFGYSWVRHCDSTRSLRSLPPADRALLLLLPYCSCSCPSARYVRKTRITQCNELNLTLPHEIWFTIWALGLISRKSSCAFVRVNEMMR